MYLESLINELCVENKNKQHIRLRLPQCIFLVNLLRHLPSMNIGLETRCKHVTEKKLVFTKFQDQQKNVFKAHLVWGSHPSYSSTPASECLSTVIHSFSFTTTPMKKTFTYMTGAHGALGDMWNSEHAGWDFTPFSPIWDHQNPSETDIMKNDISNRLLATKLEGDDNYCASHRMWEPWVYPLLKRGQWWGIQ